ncbi:MAG: hypothetical protein JXA33_04185 [Anaerolineae bacterium]|nr:hypothetical protein [Anaerolineae bacterium]
MNTPSDSLKTPSPRLTLYAGFVSLGLATGLPALGFGIAGLLWPWAISCVVVGMLWGFVLYRNVEWMANFGLCYFFGMTTFGFWRGVGSGWMLAGAVAALTAWDLDHFIQRLRDAPNIEHAQVLEQQHLRRICIVNGIGGVLAGVALIIRLHLHFGVMFLLGLIAIAALTRALTFLRRAIH